jgi:aryl-alcohol dehydrogenase
MPRTATAAIVDAVGEPFTLDEITLEDPRPDEVVVRMVASGICHTDLSLRDGVIPFPLPGVFGHEGAGIVEDVGPQVRTVRPGHRVLLSFTSCGSCRNCGSGHPAYCETFVPRNVVGGKRADGSSPLSRAGKDLGAHFFGQSSFSTLAVVDERSTVKVGADADLATLAPLGCGVQTGVGTVLNELKPEPGSVLAVFGSGAVGLSAIMGAALSAAEMIIAIDLVESRLELARELGATHVINAANVDMAEALRELTHGRGIDCGVDTTGNTKVVEKELRTLAVRGTLAAVGVPPAGSTAAVNVTALLNGQRFIGVTEGSANPARFIPVLASLVAQGRLPIERMIERFAFPDINKAADATASGQIIKPVLLFED